MNTTPRDRLQRLVDLGRKTMRYWWLVALFALVGGALSLAFAVLRPKTYQSWATLVYQERIRTEVLSPNREEVVQRNIGDKYRELLTARELLDQVVRDPALNPFPEEPDPDMAVDKLREKVKLESRGGNAFRIVYGDADRARAQLVTERLTLLLQQKDESLRTAVATNTVDFVTKQKEEASVLLRKQEQDLAGFLAKHPEFAQDSMQPGASEGAAIRAHNVPKKGQPQNPRVLTLERQRMRIQARLNAPPDQPIKITVPPSAEKIAAEAAVNEAQRELTAANRELENAQSKYQPKHPSVINAQEKVTTAQQRLRRAQAAVPPDSETTVAPATAQDREKLNRELRALEEQIANLQKAGTTQNEPLDKTTNSIVELETEHAELRRKVQQQREQVENLASAVFRAQIDASQKAAEQGSRLAIIDPAFKPVRPTGPGKTIFLMAGMVLFLSLGLALAVGMAVIDDRLYRRTDLDQLGIAVLADIPAAKVVHHKKPRRQS